MALLIKTEELEGLLKPEEILGAVEEGYQKWAKGQAFNHPRQSLQAGPTRLRVISGGLPYLDVIGLRVHADYITRTDGIKNPQVVVLYDYEQKGLLAIIVGEGYLLHFPPATSAVGAKYMARQDARTLGLFGTGGTAADFIRLFKVIRPLRAAKVYARDQERLRRFCRQVERECDIEAIPAADPKEVLRGVDLVVTATSADSPVFDGRGLEPGVHISQIVAGNRGAHEAMGLPAKRRELDTETLRRCDLICTNSKEQILIDDQGTIMDPVRQKAIDFDKIIELGELMTGMKKGRRSDKDITLFYHSGGQGVSDLPIAALLYQKAKKAGLGREL